MRHNGLKLKWGVLPRSKEKLFHCRDSRALEKVAQRICAFSVLGSFQGQSG